jgi:hypothetical protein
MDSGQIKVSVQTTPTFPAYLRFILSTAFWQVRFLIPFAILALLCFLLAPIIPFEEAAGAMAHYRDAIELLILPAIIFLLIPISNALAARKRWRTATELSVPRTYIFSDSGIEVIAETFRSTVAWSHIVSARRSRTHILLGTAQKLYYLIPVVDFGSAESYAQFKYLVNERVRNSNV